MYQDIGQFLQEAGQPEAAITYFKKALAHAEATVGQGSTRVALSCHAIAFAYATMKNFRTALDYEKRNFAICKAIYGEAAQRTVESNMCLSRWTREAVEVEVQNRKDTGAAGGQQGGKGKQQQASKKDGSTPIGGLPINEVLHYINTPSRKAGGAGKIAHGGRAGVSKAKRIGTTPAPASTTTANAPAADAGKKAKKAGGQQQQQAQQQQANGSGKKSGKQQQHAKKSADSDGVPPLI
jgi:tetratricopeptide (TPR) repeat protein